MSRVRVRSPLSLRWILVAVVLAGLLPGRVHDADRTGVAVAPSAVAPAAGARVAIDPVSGTRVPAPSAAVAPEAATAAALSRSFEGLVLVQRADGTKYVDLQGRFSSGTWVTLTPDGVSTTCRTTPGGQGPPPVAEVQ